jgi:hypothetical protein
LEEADDVVLGGKMEGLERVIRWSKASPARRLLRRRSFPVLLVAIQTMVDCELDRAPFIAAAVAWDRTGNGVHCAVLIA